MDLFSNLDGVPTWLLDGVEASSGWLGPKWFHPPPFIFWLFLLVRNKTEHMIAPESWLEIWDHRATSACVQARSSLLDDRPVVLIKGLGLENDATMYKRNNVAYASPAGHTSVTSTVRGTRSTPRTCNETTSVVSDGLPFRLRGDGRVATKITATPLIRDHNEIRTISLNPAGCIGATFNSAELLTVSGLLDLFVAGFVVGLPLRLQHTYSSLSCFQSLRFILLIDLEIIKVLGFLLLDNHKVATSSGSQPAIWYLYGPPVWTLDGTLHGMMPLWSSYSEPRWCPIGPVGHLDGPPRWDLYGESGTGMVLLRGWFQ
ncbi:hypothetical protein EAI_06975 [Harpegnathos saltator]|uniref:Uncharacterized protein n=1 Tax=Harpegnathos saltator TaxID=610380 RepID=E2BDJ9_HARSA|nr:hypothetical protein EAI_06975 [Harpegnathos saltator]